MHRHFWLALSLFLLAFLVLPSQVSAGNEAVAAPSYTDPLLDVMSHELSRARQELGKADPAPYFLSYSVTDHNATVMSASMGALNNVIQVQRRSADVTMRVGDAKLDNTHDESRYSGLSSGVLPLENDTAAIARMLWRLTDQEYKKSSQTYLKVKTNTAVHAQEEDDSPDFSKEAPQQRIANSAVALKIDVAAWQAFIQHVSAFFRKYPEISRSRIYLQADDITHYFVSSEGSAVVRPEKTLRLMIEAQTQAEDGMELLRVESFLASSPDKLPAEDVVNAKMDTMVKDLMALRAAPVAEPFSGPALLSGRAAAVFFHEVVGHRLEGQRQRGNEEGQTFAKKVNEKVLPEFLNVEDDPTLRTLNGAELSGWYDSDDEGQPSRRVDLIQNGVLKNFLMSRMPVKGFSQSNGHGRAQEGYMPVGRQGNLIVRSSHMVPDSTMRQTLLDEVKKQGKPYGLYFEDIEGGFTLTSRRLPQAFQVLPVMVWRVYADGRPDELVRGVDIVGTPLAALSHILLTGDTQQVFNGICGAESGSVPVSAAAPAMLFSEIEVQRKAQSHDRPPILPPPGAAGNPSNSAAQVQQ